MEKEVLMPSLIRAHTVKPVLSVHSKIDKTKILMTNVCLMQVESIAECSIWNIQHLMQVESIAEFSNTFDLH